MRDGRRGVLLERESKDRDIPDGRVGQRIVDAILGQEIVNEERSGLAEGVCWKTEAPDAIYRKTDNDG